MVHNHHHHHFILVILLLLVPLCSCSICSQILSCEDCVRSRVLFIPCRWCPVDNKCYSPGSVLSNKCRVRENVFAIGQCPLTKGLSPTVMMGCPNDWDSTWTLEKPPSGWKLYPPDKTVFFHCGFRGLIELPRPGLLLHNECFYDEQGALVTETHEWKDCRGTADMHVVGDGDLQTWFAHFLFDSGGVCNFGAPDAHPCQLGFMAAQGKKWRDVFVVSFLLFFFLPPLRTPPVPIQASYRYALKKAQSVSISVKAWAVFQHYLGKEADE